MEFMNGMEQIPMSTMESIDGIEPVPTEKLAPGFKLWPGYHLKVSILVVMGQNYRIHVQGVFQSEAFLLELNTGLGPHALVQHRPYEIVGCIKTKALNRTECLSLQWLKSAMTSENASITLFQTQSKTVLPN